MGMSSEFLGNCSQVQHEPQKNHPTHKLTELCSSHQTKASIKGQQGGPDIDSRHFRFTQASIPTLRCCVKGNSQPAALELSGEALARWVQPLLLKLFCLLRSIQEVRRSRKKII